MVTATEHPYIVANDEIFKGEPIIKGSRIAVRHIVEYWRAGVSPEEILTYYPHLTLAQIFDALSYYSDHQEEISKYIEKNRIPDELIAPLVR